MNTKPKTPAMPMFAPMPNSTAVLRQGHGMSYQDVFCEPIALTSAYTFANAAEAAARFGGTQAGNVYSRFTNPSVKVFEERVAVLEHAQEAVAFASGMAAIAAVMMAFTEQGCNVVCARDVFGTTLVALRHYFERFGVEVRVVNLRQPESWLCAIDANTRLVFLETPSNPMQDVIDLTWLAGITQRHGALLVVDNTLLTPIMQQPLQLGADLVIHSAGKYMDGQGRCVAGVVAGHSKHMPPLRGVLRSLGFCLSPMNAWLLSKSLETLSLRMQQINQTSHALALWLQSQAGIGKVYYTGLPQHPGHRIAKKQQQGFGGVLSFEVGQTQRDAWQWIDHLRCISIATNIGDTRSMVTHPASTTHGRLSPEERRTANIQDNLVRISVGLEDLQTLQADILQALQNLPLRTPNQNTSPSPNKTPQEVNP